MAKAMNFKSKASYLSWLRVAKSKHPGPSKNPVKVSIKGKKHKVNHSNKAR